MALFVSLVDLLPLSKTISEIFDSFPNQVSQLFHGLIRTAPQDHGQLAQILCRKLNHFVSFTLEDVTR